MWWFDQGSVKIGEMLRDKFDISTFIETGTYRGINLRFWSYRFKEVTGVEYDAESYLKTFQKINQRPNVSLEHNDSSIFLKHFVDNYYIKKREDVVLIYLDAHFYTQGEKKTKEDRWLVLRELKALRGFKNCIIVIHDFNCNDLYGLVYDNEPLDFDLVKDSLYKINPYFHYYINTRDKCQPHTEESVVGVAGLENDLDTIETIQYHCRSDRLMYRGILYCLPRSIDASKFGVIQLN